MTPTPSSTEATTAGGLTDRLRNQWALAQSRFDGIEARAKARWVALPEQLRATLDRFVERMIKRLDLPTRADLADLNARIDDLHRKLAAFEATRTAPAAPAPQAVAADPILPAADEAAMAESSHIDRKHDGHLANKSARRKPK